jgi:hypothetical protein
VGGKGKGASATGSGGLSNLELAAMAIAAAVTAANLYYCQPLVAARLVKVNRRDTRARDFGLWPMIGAVLSATCTLRSNTSLAEHC